MILWVDGAHDPRENMGRDSGLLAAAEAGAEPVLRLFRFSPAGITLGRAQDPGRMLDLARCARDRMPWAVRPTGGRAILHDQEWTYSFAAPLSHPDGAGSIAAAYARLSSLLVRSLARLGVPATLAPGERGARGEAGGALAPCFASTARHEIVLEGRKLVGSAQRRTARALLQQGSLLLGPGHERLADYLAASEERREPIRRALRAAAAHAGALLGPLAPLERWADALIPELPSGSRRIEGVDGLVLLAPHAPARAGA
jgi:lipoate-protein ligase A